MNKLCCVLNTFLQCTACNRPYCACCWKDSPNPSAADWGRNWGPDHTSLEDGFRCVKTGEPVKCTTPYGTGIIILNVVNENEI